MQLGHCGFAEEGLHGGGLPELVEVVHGSLLAQLRSPNTKILHLVRAPSESWTGEFAQRSPR